MAVLLNDSSMITLCLLLLDHKNKLKIITFLAKSLNLFLFTTQEVGKRLWGFLEIKLNLVFSLKFVQDFILLV